MTTFTLKNGLTVEVKEGQFDARGFSYKYAIIITQNGFDYAKTFTDNIMCINQELAYYGEL